MTKSEFGARIKARREHLKMTQQDLATAINVEQPTIAGYEAGRREVKSTELPRLAKALGVPVSYFFDGHDSDYEDPHAWTAERRGSEGDIGTDRRLSNIEDQLKELLERFKQADKHA